MDDLELFGVSEEDANEWIISADQPEEDFFVDPENWTTVMVFISMETQWDILVGMGGALYQGLKYDVLPVVMGFMNVPKKDRAEVFSGLRIMERAAKVLLNSDKDSEKKSS